MVNKFECYYATLSWFAKNPEIHKTTRLRALEIICLKIAEVMDIKRVGVWFFTADKSAIYEEMTYVIEGKNSTGSILLKKDYPIYFKHISEERVVESSNTLKDEATSEFADTYMRLLNIHALLDAPIFSDGEMIGILCCENTKETRDWDLLDKNFVASCADLIGRITETEKRHSYEKDLRHRIDYLENDLKKRLDDLNEAKLSLDLALEGAQVGKWDWNIETGHLTLNKTWYTKLGYEFNEIPQELASFKKVLYPDDVARVFEELNRHLTGGADVYICRYRMITKQGEIQWCLDRGRVTHRNAQGKPLRMIGVNVNITPLIKLEETLIISEQQLKAMIQSLPAPVAMFNRDFKYLAFSTRWEEEWRRFGKAEEGLSIKDGKGKFKPEWIEKMEEALQGVTLTKDEDLVDFTSEIQLWLRWVIQPWKTADGHIGGVVVMAENITHRKEAEMRLAQASKLSALGEMAGGIAHEINNPLGIIKGYIDLLKRHSSRHSLSQELMLQYIDKMDLTVGRISRIVNGMRRFSRESSMDEKVEYSLNKIIEETLDICQERINNNGTAVNVEYFKQEPIIYCRPVEISQVLLNLINNAYQAVSIFAHPWINIKCEESHGNYRILITDCGSGIPHYIRQKLFQPFFTTKDIGVGTGLGLSISRGIVEEHHGRLYYLEEANNTTFVIELPKLNKVDTQISQ